MSCLCDFVNVDNLTKHHKKCPPGIEKRKLADAIEAVRIRSAGVEKNSLLLCDACTSHNWAPKRRMITFMLKSLKISTVTMEALNLLSEFAGYENYSDACRCYNENTYGTEEQ